MSENDKTNDEAATQPARDDRGKKPSPSTPSSCDPTERCNDDSSASSASSYKLSPEVFQKTPPKILWSCVARNDVILAEANDIGNHDREDVADAARQLLQQSQTPGFEYHTQNRLKGMLKANFGKHKTKERFVPLKGIKFHVFEHVAEESLRFAQDDAPELRVWVFAAVFDPNGTCRADVQSFLEKMVHITDDLRTYDPEWKAARQLGLQHSFAPTLQQRMEEVTYLGKMSLLKQQVHACQEQMEHNIDLMLDNAGRAEDLDEEASHLQEMCKVFRKKAKQVKRHQMLKNAKYGLVAGTAATGVAAAVIVPLVVAL